MPRQTKPLADDDLVSIRGARAIAGDCHTRTIDRALAAGHLTLAGRRGGIGPRMFRRGDVVRWATGADATPPAPPVSSGARSRPRSTSTASTTDALERIKRAAGGAR